MERLVTTAQAAEILGLSLPGVHYRIKKNRLKSIKKSGRLYVYISDEMQEESTNQIGTEEIRTKTRIINNDNPSNETASIIYVKDEQIKLLKKSLKWMKRQYLSEINRLEKNHLNMMDVFKSEIKLLQSAFNEMRSIYKPQIEELSKPSKKDENIKKDESEFISLKDFSILMKRNHKSQNDIKLIILRAIKNNDRRFIYNKRDKKLLILKSKFKDLI